MLAIETQNRLKIRSQVRSLKEAREARVVNNPIVKSQINQAKVIQTEISKNQSR